MYGWKSVGSGCWSLTILLAVEVSFARKLSPILNIEVTLKLRDFFGQQEVLNEMKMKRIILVKTQFDGSLGSEARVLLLHCKGT
jgi:hypothetical protein